MFSLLKKLFGTAQERQVKRLLRTVTVIRHWEERFSSLSDEELKGKTVAFRKRYADGESLDQLLPEAYAVVINACRRLVGTEVHVSGYDQRWDMVPFDVQLVGAIALHRNSIAEMQTGEGKTLTAVLPLYLNALSGKAVHLVTVNDYLAKRDCEWVGAVLRWLGLTTAALTNSAPLDQRHAIYEADVVYGTAAEFGFDYLRDNSMAQSLREQVQRGHFFAIIDEVDSILIDEARTPLIISGPAPNSRQLYDELKGAVAQLVRKQGELCNQLASDAKREVEPFLAKRAAGTRLTKEEQEREASCWKKLWLVGKGMPRHRIVKKFKEESEGRVALDQWDLYFYGEANKEERQALLSTLYITVDERSNDYELTDLGIQLWPLCTGDASSSDDFIMLDIAAAYLEVDEIPALSDEERRARKLAIREVDAQRKERAHNLRQLLRAHLMMERDVDYIVQEGKIIIIDENTGRPQPGRRYSDGLHQAIEAKESVPVQKETQTYATITLQNYFRMYDKLAGMSGTVMTEAEEFKKIYSLDALEIPTHRPCRRHLFNDEIYMTEREKYQAVLRDIEEMQAKGRPVLVGTPSVEISEKLSRICRQKDIDHTVLNAKHPEQEAHIVAHAGVEGAVTIATNMAGRGTDIKLGAGIAERGGLHVIGVSRHMAARIDRQLSGRSARQGDPGSAKFFLSMEDPLLRLFSAPRLTAIIQKFRPPEGEPLGSAKILNHSIRTAQKRIEQRNFAMRKHTLEYDDVMNKQRQAIYHFRNEILGDPSAGELACSLIREVCHATVERFCSNRFQQSHWQPEALHHALASLFPISLPESLFTAENSPKILAEEIIATIETTFSELLLELEAELPQPVAKEIIDRTLRMMMLHRLDHLWQEHLLVMDHLRTDVSLRVVGQRDPLTEFKHEAFSLFEKLSERLREEIVQTLFTLRISHTPRNNGLQPPPVAPPLPFVETFEPGQLPSPMIEEASTFFQSRSEDEQLPSI